MSQRVPRWELEESNDSARIPFLGRQHANHTPPGELMLDYEVTELTWVNGQLVMQGMGRPTEKPISKEAWEKPQASGTLESIVDQATGLPPRKPGTAADDLVPWFDHHAAAAAAAAMDALVPCGSHADDHPAPAASEPSAGVEVSTRVGSCSGRKRARAGCGGAREESSRNQSESRPLTIDTCELDPSSAETSSFGKPLSSQSKPTTTSADDHDSDSLTRSQGRGREAAKKRNRGRSSISIKRSRAAAIHNQSERKRRDKINQRMKTLQKLVPNASKTDKASMLDEVIEYLKQLQYQIHMLSKMSSIPNMMMPMPMQNLQMAMMAQMGMGMNINMNMPMGVMDMNNIAGMTPMLHHPFLPMSNPWDAAAATDHRLTTPAPLVLPEHYLAFLACQSQPMNLDAYSRMAAMYQQLHQTMAPTNSKN